MINFNGLFAISILTLLCGCSTYSKRECASMNWQAQGQQMALKGWTKTATQQHFENECHMENEVTVDNQALTAGYDSGVKEFCSPQNAYRFAKDGGIYRSTCEQATETEFLKRYHTGREEFLEGTIASLEGKIRSLESENSALEQRASAAESEASHLRGQSCRSSTGGGFL